MKSIDLQTRLIDLTSRIGALDTILWSYIKVKESPENYSLLRKSFRDCYLKTLEVQAKLLFSENDAKKSLTFLKTMFSAEEKDLERLSIFASLDAMVLKMQKKKKP